MKISVVTISFNQGEYLQECINSVINTNLNIEYIIVDPGSEDGSRQIIDNNSKYFSKIIFEKDSGPADGLNKGFSYATGDIFYYLNSDDKISPGAFEFVINYFTNNPEVDVLCGAISIINQKSKKSFRKRTSDEFNLANYISGICTICQQATFFRSEAFKKAGGFNVNNHITWDGELIVDMYKTGSNIVPIYKILGEFRIYPSSITGSKNFLGKQRSEFERIKSSLLESNTILNDSIFEVILKVIYKINILRHIKYLFVK